MPVRESNWRRLSMAVSRQKVWAFFRTEFLTESLASGTGFVIEGKRQWKTGLPLGGAEFIRYTADSRSEPALQNRRQEFLLRRCYR